MILIQKSKFIADEKYLTKLISLLLFIGDKFSFVNKCHIVTTYESVNGRNVLVKFLKLLLVTDSFPFFNVFFLYLTSEKECEQILNFRIYA